MRKKKIDLTKFENHELLKIAETLQENFHKVSNDLLATRQKLMKARKRIRKINDTVHFQRQRIIELYT